MDLGAPAPHQRFEPPPTPTEAHVSRCLNGMQWDNVSEHNVAIKIHVT